MRPLSTGDRPAKTLIQDYVELEFIDPDDLENLVVSSGLVHDNQLASALLKQAKKAKHEHNISFCKQSTLEGEMLEWKNAKSKVFTSKKMCYGWESDVLAGPILGLGGKYQWILQADRSSNVFGSWLGVTKSTHKLHPKKSCSEQKNCWGFSPNSGYAYEDGVTGECLGNTANNGRASQQVTMILDLSDGNSDNGILSFSVDGGETTKVASNMRAHLVGTSVGYVPAVSGVSTTFTIVECKLL